MTEKEPEDTCRPVEVDGEIISVYGSEEMTEEDRGHFAEIVRAAKAKAEADDRARFAEARQHGLKARHETRVERAIRRAIINAEWKATEDDTVDGWCVLDAATGNVLIAHFCHAEAARHMAVIHNLWLANQGYLPIPATIESTVRVQVAEEIAAALDRDARQCPPNSVPSDAFTRAARMAREIGARETS